MFERRRVIAAALAALAVFSTWRFVRGSAESAVVAVLRKQLAYLRLEEAGLQAYAHDLVVRAAVSTNKMRVIDMVGPIYARFEAPGYPDVLTRDLRHGEERIVSLYLLSSDFFENGADETRLVRYRGFYDPLTRPHACGNPFARARAA